MQSPRHVHGGNIDAHAHRFVGIRGTTFLACVRCLGNGLNGKACAHFKRFTVRAGAGGGTALNFSSDNIIEIATCNTVSLALVVRPAYDLRLRLKAYIFYAQFCRTHIIFIGCFGFNLFFEISVIDCSHTSAHTSANMFDRLYAIKYTPMHTRAHLHPRPH